MTPCEDKNLDYKSLVKLSHLAAIRDNMKVMYSLARIATFVSDDQNRNCLWTTAVKA